MLHAKFQNHRPSGSGEEDFLKVFAIYSHGGHLGHVTLTIYTTFHSLFLKRYKWAKIRKRRNQRKVPTPKTEVGKNQSNN